MKKDKIRMFYFFFPFLFALQFATKRWQSFNSKGGGRTFDPFFYRSCLIPHLGRLDGRGPGLRLSRFPPLPEHGVLVSTSHSIVFTFRNI